MNKCKYLNKFSDSELIALAKSVGMEIPVPGNDSYIYLSGIGNEMRSYYCDNKNTRIDVWRDTEKISVLSGVRSGIHYYITQSVSFCDMGLISSGGYGFLINPNASNIVMRSIVSKYPESATELSIELNKQATMLERKANRSQVRAEKEGLSDWPGIQRNIRLWRNEAIDYRSKATELELLAMSTNYERKKRESVELGNN